MASGYGNDLSKREKDTIRDQTPLTERCQNVNTRNQTFHDREKQYDYPENHCRTLRYENVREYAQALQPWLYQYRIMTSMNMFYSTLPHLLMGPMSTETFNRNQQYSSLPGFTPAAGFGQHQRARPSSRLTSPNRPQHHTHGTVYWVPSVFKRVIAELLDFVVLFYIKLLVSVIVLKQLGFMDNSVVFVSMDLPTLMDVSEMDYDKAFALTSELIALEIINRICITIVETLCLRHGYAGAVGGATPGKRMMGMKVVSCTEIIEQGNGQILVTPAQNIGLFSALVRSSIKNFTIAFFFPACLSVFFFQNNRAIYDVIAGTIVVQSNGEH
ncbi:hypothetical protein ScPMuIL_009720 [Solemya velum]